MTIDVEAWRRARHSEESHRVTQAKFVFVAVDEERRPRRVPPMADAVGKFELALVAMPPACTFEENIVVATYDATVLASGHGGSVADIGPAPQVGNGLVWGRVC